MPQRASKQVTPKKRGSGPGLAHGLSLVALLVVLAAAALTVRQPPPPSIAQFAPGDVHQIKAPQKQQASTSGLGAGSGGGGGLKASPRPRALVSASLPPVGPVIVPRSLNCVGNPPRQTEDPQSPPCIAYWQGDNGGATSPGVTRNQINIVVPTYRQNQQMYQDFEKFVNERFELYGRQLNFEFSPSGSQNGEPGQKADADNDYATYKPFAATNYNQSAGLAYGIEMSRLKVIYSSPDTSLGSYPTNYFGYFMGANPMFENVGEWVCNQLVGQPAVHAGSVLSSKTRKFGVIFDSVTADDPTTADALVKRLQACGVTPTVTQNQIGNGSFGKGNNANDAQRVVLKMQQAGVTSVICLCQLGEPATLFRAATEQAYQPEWMLSGYEGIDNAGTVDANGSDANQLQHAFGLTFVPPQAPITDEPASWAIKEVDPSFNFAAEDNIVLAPYNLWPAYHSVLVLAAGIQMAGPDLTPATFAAGLARTTFPNPPYFTQEGKVGFGLDPHTMTDDAAQWWWSNSDKGPFAGAPNGTPCYVDNGRRYSLGNWPHGGDPFFKGACNTGSKF